MVSGPGTIAIERVGKENARAEQSQNRRHNLDHRNIPSRPAWERTIAALHSQKDSNASERDAQPTEVLAQHSVRKRHSGDAEKSPDSAEAKCAATIDSPRSGLSPFPPRSGCVIVIIRCGGGPHPALLAARDPNSGKRPGGMVVWGEWGFGGQIRFSGRRAARLPSSTCLVLANCASSDKFASRVDPKYGVSSSPRVVALGDPVPKGGGTYRVGKPYTVGGPGLCSRRGSELSRRGHGLLVWRRFPWPADRQWRGVRHDAR